MAHEISLQGGRAEIAYAGDTPWHGLGVKVDGLQTAAAMLKAAGLEWTVGTAPVFCNGREVTTHRAVLRGDTSAVLGVVSDRYTPIQNTQAGDVVDALVTEGGAHVEVAGALGNGERCWMLARIPGEFDVVKGDTVRPYFLLAWGHDGKHGLAGKLTPIRVVCNNTLTAAGFGGGRWKDAADFYVKHSRNARLNIEEAQRALGIVRKQVEQTAEAFRALAGQQLLTYGARDYFAGVFPAPAADVEGYEERLARWNEHQARMLALYDNGVGHEVPGVRGTAWAAYNAVTEFTDHAYPVLKSGEVSQVRQQSVLFGSYAATKTRALENALALVG
jgi:phage/plasmid-like protein (TIGR03299 family)